MLSFWKKDEVTTLQLDLKQKQGIWLGLKITGVPQPPSKAREFLTNVNATLGVLSFLESDRI